MRSRSRRIAVRQDAKDQRTIGMMAMYAGETVLDGIAKSISKRVDDSMERRDTIIAMRLGDAIEAYNIAGRLVAQTTPQGFGGLRNRNSREATLVWGSHLENLGSTFPEALSSATIGPSLRSHPGNVRGSRLAASSPKRASQSRDSWKAIGSPTQRAGLTFGNFRSMDWTLTPWSWRHGSRHRSMND
jgi:hypothetical protein